MGNFDLKFRAGAKRVLDKVVGTAVNATLTASHTRAQYDPESGSVSGSPSSYSIRSSPIFSNDDKMIVDDVTQASTGYVVVDSLELEAKGATGIDAGWKFTKNNVTWRVTRTVSHSGGDQNCLVEIHLEK